MMRPTLRLALLACALGATVSGCSNPYFAGNRQLDSINQPVVERQNFVMDLDVAGAGLPVDERRRLAAWFSALKLGYGDRVSIDSPAGSKAGKADVEALIAEYGLLLADPAPVTTGEVWPGKLRVVVTRSRASVPNCPNWDAKGEANPNNATHSNYGCATNSNLAAMISDPEDLIRGKSSAGVNVGAGSQATTGATSAANGAGNGAGAAAGGGAAPAAPAAPSGGN